MSASQVLHLSRGLLRQGIKPTPTVINRGLHRMHRAHTNMLNGEEAAARRQAFKEFGWWCHPLTGRWQPPNRG